MNAGDLALQHRGTYVEGFALYPDGRGPVHHAWLTLDGIHAVDVTWRMGPAGCDYFGITFTNGVLERFTSRTRSWGPLLGSSQHDEVLRDAGLSATPCFSVAGFALPFNDLDNWKVSTAPPASMG